MPLTTFSANSTARASEVNANFALCVLTDTAKTITVGHTWSARQLFSEATLTSASATAFAVGLTGATNSAFSVDASTALQVAGLNVKGAVTGGTVALVVTDSGADASVTFNAKGIGTIGIGSASTGRVTITPVTTITGLVTLTGGFASSAAGTVTSSSATALAVGLAGATNPAFVVDASTASQASGIKITGKANGTGLSNAVIIEAISSGATADLVLRNKGTGFMYLGTAGGGIQWNNTAVAEGAGASVVAGKVGGAGPASATFRRWIPIYEDDGNLSFFPVWR